MFRPLSLAAMLIVLTLFPFRSFSQVNNISGTVKSSGTSDPVPSVTVSIENSAAGTFTDPKGNFTITTHLKFPLNLIFSAVGFETKFVAVNSNKLLEVLLVPTVALGQEVVVSANRVPSRIMESPVSIERVGNTALRNSAAPSFYDVIANLKGVDMISSSLLFKSPTTRGFAQSGNARFNQFISGMDNQAPGLNFSVASIIGVSDLDVESVELLQGASSALYGSGGMNGTLLINTKNPFKYQGLSFQLRTGIMGTVDPSPFAGGSLRWAQTIGSKLAYKIGVEYLRAQDWYADDYRNYSRFGSNGGIIPGTRDTDPNYDGVNVYGDETSANVKTVLNAVAVQAPFLKDFIDRLPANIPVSRTGYRENEIVNPITYNIRLSGALHYKISNSVEASLTGYWGNGNTVYTGITRYSLLDLKMGQYKLELNHKKWFLRGYTTQENAGEAHNLTVTTQLVNEAWKPSDGGSGWYATYGQTYLAKLLEGKSDLDAHNIARSVADIGRPAPRSDQFKRLYDSIRLKPIPDGGLLLDRTDLWMVDGQYNFSEDVKFFELLVGGSWKQYILNSKATLFADKEDEPIHINEYGGYIQVAKALFNDVLKLTASGRYDKQQDFKGKFTPRITALVKVAKDNNIRMSFQTAYRFPTNQQQWINLYVGSGWLIGGNKKLWEMHGLLDNPVYAASSIPTGNLVQVNYVDIKPESVKSFEAGYKGVIKKKLLVDMYGYYTEYTNFISRRDIVKFKNPQAGPSPENLEGFSVVVNAPGTVKSYGWGLSLDYLLPANFVVSGNVSSDILDKKPDDFRADFNSPKYRTNLSLSNNAFGHDKNLACTITWRWQDGFFYQSDFASGDQPSVSTVDAQFSYRLQKSVFKIGATNLLNSPYRNGVANATIGGLYYLSYGFNIY